MDKQMIENAVVLTREEYEKLDIVKEMYDSVDKIKVSDILQMLAMTDKVARKETAEKIKTKAKEKAYFKDGGYYDKDRYLLDMADLDEICKEITDGEV